LTISNAVTKTCSCCNKEKRLDDFPKNSKGKYQRGQKCLVCTAAITKAYVEKNHDLVYAKKYKTSQAKITALLKREVCDICGAPGSSKKRNSIDHDHETAQVRGLLCDSCNLGLGKFKDSPELLQRAIQYLEKHNA
jgi:hypothetical protein